MNRSRYDPAKHGPRRIVGPGFHAQVYELVEKIPAGRVTTYGDIGRALGSVRVARQVGYALAALDEDRSRAVPWFRVVLAGGRIPRGTRQVERLLEEGVDIEGDRVRDFADRHFTLGGPE